MTNFVFVTQSTSKLAEAERITGRSLEHYRVGLPEIQAVEVEDVVLFKARTAYAELGKPVMIEDTGLFIDAWNGLPGALIKWFVERMGEPGICRMMQDFSNRRARAKTVVATYDGRIEPTIFVGVVEGEISLAPAGTGGFGWDKIFIPIGAKKTFGEMTGQEKDRYSMRRQAFKKMLAHYY
jgi:non-canonical purine NTP pyrophosphatase (RdgB/HAM1 family)